MRCIEQWATNHEKTSAILAFEPVAQVTHFLQMISYFRKMNEKSIIQSFDKLNYEQLVYLIDSYTPTDYEIEISEYSIEELFKEIDENKDDANDTVI